MSELWRNLVPLAVAGAIVPAPFVVTILLLRTSLASAGAWIAGMTVVRLLQGLVFGVILSDATTVETAAGRETVFSAVLLVLSVTLFVTAAKQLAGGDDPDAPPPKWMAAVESIGTGKAFALGAGLVAINAKLWVFTLGAIAAIEEAHEGRHAGVVSYLVFVALVLAPQLAALAYALVAPARARRALDEIADWLRRHNRAIVVAVSLVFGTWFLVKALRGLGVM